MHHAVWACWAKCQKLTANSIVAVHGLYGSQHPGWTGIGWKDGLVPPLPSGYRLSCYSYDVFSCEGGIMTRSGARDEATKLLDALLRLRGKDSKVAPSRWPQ